MARWAFPGLAKVCGVLLAALLMGTTCTPTPPGCPYEGTCPSADTTVAESCINFCTPIFDEPVIDDTVFCALDECDRTLFEERDDVWRCPPTNAAGQQYICVPADSTPDPSRIGVCRASSGILDACDPAETDSCEAGSYCADVSECPLARADAERLRLPPDSDFCWLPAREGEPCDSNLGRGLRGCRPCEWGTWCRDTVSYGPLCLRACATPDEPATARPELCACARPDPCDAYDDIAPPDPAFPVATGEPQIYCTPPLVQNGSSCRPQGVPCDDPLSWCQDTVQPLYGKRTICCRDDGAECTEASHCCEGRSACVSGRCTPCGLDGDDPTEAGCCPGYVVVDQVCRACTSSREGRDAARLEGASCEGDFLQLENEDGQRQTFAIPVRGSTGAGPAEMPLTSGRSVTVRYGFRPTHRPFLMEGDLTGRWARTPATGQHPPTYLASSAGPWPAAGITVGHRFLHLPPSSPGAPGVVDLTMITDASGAAVPTATWQSLRVYDAGACSSFQEYGRVTDLVVAALNRFLVIPQFGIFGSTPLTLLGQFDDGGTLDQRAHITPILASAGGDFMRASEQDQLGLFVGYQARGGDAFGCPNGRLWFSAGLRVVRDAAVAPTLASEELDPQMTEWHDFINDGSFCLDGDCSYCWRPGECREVCTIDRDRYECNFFVPDVASSFGHREPRPVLVLRDAFDYRPELVYLDGGLVACWLEGLNDLLTSIIAGKIRQILPGVFGQITGQLTIRLPDARLGVTFDDLADCGRRLPSGEVVPSDALCSAAPLFGNRRMRCIGFDADRRRQSAPELVTSYRCADLVPEVRRLNLRPDGAEIVLSDSATDPQHRLVQALDSALCTDTRPGTVDPTEPRIPAETIERGYASLSALGPRARRICHPDDALTARPSGGFTGCEGMCGDIGVPCITVRGIRNIAPGSSCYSTRTRPDEDRHVSFCCHPDSFCAIPESAGGRRFFDDPVAGSDPPAFWACVDLSSNPLACGACGVACSTGERCCGATCIDPLTDSRHCGSCGAACAGGAPCSAGSCCGAGESICDGVCTDTSTHSDHCGACGHACAAGETCSAALCCPADEVNCAGRCTAVLEDENSCGACDRVCAPGAVCTNGVCCTGLTADCNGDGRADCLSVDPSNCGACGNACAFGSVCIAGRCV